MKLANKVAWITGGNSGIGFATARLFVTEGARVAITGRNPKTLQAAAKELGDNVLALQCPRKTQRKSWSSGLARAFHSADSATPTTSRKRFCTLLRMTLPLFRGQRSWLTAEPRDLRLEHLSTGADERGPQTQRPLSGG